MASFIGGRESKVHFELKQKMTFLSVFQQYLISIVKYSVDKKPELLRAYTLAPFSTLLEWKKEAHFTRQVLPFVRFL